MLSEGTITVPTVLAPVSAVIRTEGPAARFNWPASSRETTLRSEPVSTMKLYGPVVPMETGTVIRAWASPSSSRMCSTPEGDAVCGGAGLGTVWLIAGAGAAPASAIDRPMADRIGVVRGKSVAVRVDLVGCRHLKKIKIK